MCFTYCNVTGNDEQEKVLRGVEQVGTDNTVCFTPAKKSGNDAGNKVGVPKQLLGLMVISAIGNMLVNL